MADDIAGQLLDRDQVSSWCGDQDMTGRYVCTRIRNHALDWHAGRNTAGGIHQWPASAGAPQERCFDDCPAGGRHGSGNTEDCTCLGSGPAVSAVTGDLRARVVDVVLDVIADGAISTQEEASEYIADVVLAVVQPVLAEVRASCEAWAIEADRLDAELKERPTAWAYEQADRALEKRRVALVEALGARPGAGFYDSVDDVAELVRDRAALSGMLRGMARRASAMRRALRARPAVPADAEDLRTQLLDWAAILTRGGGMVVPSDIAWKLRQYAATASWHGRMCSGCGQHVAAREPEGVGRVLCTTCHPGDLPFKAGSDTTAQPEPRTWTADDPEPPGDVRQVSAANSQVFTRRTFWQPGVGALLPWGVVAKRTGVLTEVVPSGGDTDTTEDGGDR